MARTHAALIGWLIVGISTGSALADEPTLDERLERLAEEIERNRVAHHVPGCAIAVVKGDEVIFAQGFGLADIENEVPATSETRFFIGSVTKSFTATLLGMLVDDGLISWDDPVERHLPYFKLAIDSDDEEAQATIRDILSHRTGFPRMSMLFAEGALSSEEILRRAPQAEPFAPFRKRFYYSNVMYLAAGWAGAAAAGEDWHELIGARIFKPLGMTDSQTSIRDARGGSRVARGYAWDEHLEEFKLHVPGPDDVSVDPVAPAGSISSTVTDMAKWLRFLLDKGVVDGSRLISEEALTETWNEQIKIGGGIGYGMGWMIREWQGQPLFEHGGAIPGGFMAQIAILPEADLGFVLLANSFPTLMTSVSANLVPTTLLGKWKEDDVASEVGDFRPYLGKYTANFATFSNEVFTVLERNGQLALDIPSQMVFELKPPDERGRWQFALTDQVAVSFERDDAGDVIAIKVYQAGMEFEALREGVEIEPEIDLDELHKYLGSYKAEERDLQMTVLVHNQRLGFEINGARFDLHPPDDEGRWVGRANSKLSIAFDVAEDGAIVGLELTRPVSKPLLFKRKAGEDETSLPTIEELVALRRKAPESSTIKNYRTSGSVRFPNAAVEGTFEMTIAGDDRWRFDIDVGRFGKIRVALDGDRAWRDTTFELEPFRQLRGKLLAQTRLSHPSALYGDWREFFDSASVLRAGELQGRKIYLVRLKTGELPVTKLSVDADTGDVLKVENTIVLPEIGGLRATTINEDFRDVHGMRLPYRSIESNEQTGQTILEVERVEVNVELDEELFILRPPAE